MLTVGFAQYILLLFLLGGLVGGSLVSLIVPQIRGRIEQLEPGVRAGRILFWSGLPVAIGGLVVGFVLLPSLLDYAGWMADHCLAHASGAGHHGHLCPVHTTHMHAAAAGWWLLGAIGALIGVRVGREVVGWVAARRRLGEIEAASRRSEEGPWRVVDSERPFAFTTGLVDPVVYLSSGLQERLDEASCRVVLAHELHHARRRHGAVQLVVRLVTAFVSPGVRSWLLSELALAFEQSSDGHAAEAVDGPVSVAETILAVERFAHETRPAHLKDHRAPGFGGGDLERRVRSLVDEPTWRPAGAGLWIASIVVFIGTAAHYETLHHMAETLFELL